MSRLFGEPYLTAEAEAFVATLPSLDPSDDSPLEPQTVEFLQEIGLMESPPAEAEREERENRAIDAVREDPLFREALALPQSTSAVRRWNQVREEHDLPAVDGLPPISRTESAIDVLNTLRRETPKAVMDAVAGVSSFIQAIDGIFEDRQYKYAPNFDLSGDRAAEVRRDSDLDNSLAHDLAAITATLADIHLPPDPRLRESFMLRAVPQGVASTAPFIGAAVIGGPVAAGVAGLGSMAESERRAAIQAGATDSQKRMSVLAGGLLGTTEAALPMAMSGRFARAVLKPLDTFARGAISRAIIKHGGALTLDAVVEAAQEGLVSQPGQNLIAKHIRKESRDLFEGAGESAEVGGAVGFIFGLVSKLAGVRMPRFRSQEAQRGADIAEAMVDQHRGTYAIEEKPDAQEITTPEGKEADTKAETAEAITQAQQGLLTDVQGRRAVGQTDPTPNQEAFTEAGYDKMSRTDRAAEISRLEAVPRGKPPVSPPEISESSPDARRGAAPQEGRTPTSVKNAVVDQERAKRGLRPAMQAARLANPAVWAEAMRRIEANPLAQAALISELAQKPRTVDPVESSMLLHRQIELQNAYDNNLDQLEAAQKVGDVTVVAQAQSLDEAMGVELLQLYDIQKSTGTAWGVAGQIRKMLANEDFTLARMLAKKRAAVATAELSAEDSATVREAHRKIADLERRLGEYTSKIEELESRRGADEVIAEAGRRVRRRKPRRAAAARADVKAAWSDLEGVLSGKLFANPLDPEILSSMTKLARAYVRLGVAKLGDFVAQVTTKLGEDKAKRLSGSIRAAWDAAVAEETPKPTRDLAEAEAVPGFARKLAEFFVGQGVTDRDALVDAVHGELVKAMPDITRRQTMDAISGYGDFQTLSQDEIKKKLRDLKGQMQQIAKLEDMRAGQAPLKTGLERRTPSDEERRLIAQVNEMKKLGGFDVTDPARQLRTALDAVKRRLDNQIADLEEEIRTRAKIVKDRKSVALDKEAEAKVARRDELRKQRDEIFGRRELTDEQRVRSAMAATQRSIDEYRRRLDEKDITPKPKEAKTPTTPELAALRAEREALKEEFQHLKNLLEPKKTPEERALSALKAGLRRRAADYQQRLADGDFAPRKRKKTKPDAEAERLRYAAEKAKADFHKALEADRLARRSTPQKAAETALELVRLSRSLKTSFDISATLRQGGWVVASHPSLLKNVGASLQAAVGAPEAGAGTLESALAILSGKQGRAVASRIQNEINNRPNASLYKRADLALTDPEGSLTAREEEYRGRLSKKVPGVAASERAYVAYLNLVRADMFDILVANIGPGGTVTDAEAKVLANYVNAATGRATVKKLAVAAGAMADVFFSPRWVASRFQLLGIGFRAGYTLSSHPFRSKAGRQSRRAQLLVAKEYARSLTGMSLVISTLGAALWALVGPPGDDPEKHSWNIELDPRSSDFGKIRIGDTRHDLLVGLSQTTVMLARVLSGDTKQLSTGDLVPIRGEDVPYGGTTTSDVLVRFVRSKLAPVPGAIWNVLEGKNVVGEKVTAQSTALDLTVPLAFADIRDAMLDQGIPRGAASGLTSVLGVGIQTFGQRTQTRKLIAQFRSDGANTPQGMLPLFREHWKSQGKKPGSNSFWENWRAVRQELERQEQGD